MKHIYVFLITLFIGSFGFSQTTVTYEFSSGAVTGLNESSPGITVDPNIGFGSFKNSGTSNPALNSGQLRLYQNATKGGSIIIYANNGATITDITVYGSNRTGDAGYTVDGGSATNLSGGSTYTMSSISASTEVEFYQRESGSNNRIYVDSFEVTYTMPATCTSPAVQASTFTTLSATTTDVNIEFTRGYGDDVLVVMKEGSAVDADPISGTSYIANSIFNGAGASEIGTGNYVVFNGNNGTSNPGVGGSSLSISVSDLNPSTTYHLAIYEYYTTDTCYNLTAFTGNFTTETPTTVQFTSTSASVAESAGTYDLVIEIANEDVAATTFDVALTSGDAADIDSYTTQSETFPGSSTTDITVTITVTDDAIIETDEVFTFEIQSVAGGNSAAVGTNNAFDLTITNNDFPTTVEFTSSSASVSEGVGTYDLEFTIANENATATSFEVVLTGGDGDAADINGYTTQTITFPGGSVVNQVVTLTVTDDAILEANETLIFEIQIVTGGSSAVAGTNNSFTLTLTNNDVAPPISLPYSEDFSDCGAAEWTPYDEAGNDEWICSSGEYAINGFSSTNDTDWLISDFTIDFSAYSSVKIDVTTQERYGDNINTPGEFELLYSMDYSGGDPTLATWTTLAFDPNNTEFGGGLSAPSITSVDASSITGVAYIAFKYDMTYGSGAEDWRVQNVDIYEDIALDADTEIFAPTTQIELLTPITAADVTTSATAEDAFGFVIEDQGTTDNLPTNVTTMRFVPGPNNTAGWSDHIQGITLYDENLVDYTPTTTITDTEIILDFGTPISITDGTSLEFVLGFYLNTTNIVDSSVIQFQIDSASNGFAANISGSGFADPFLLGDIVSNDIIVDVYVTELVFSQQPSNTLVNAAMTPDVSVSAVDANGNVDTSYDLDIEITSTGTLTGSPITATPVNGVATFTGLTHTVIGTALVLTADDDLYPTVNSSSFDIEEPPVIYNGVGVFEKITSLAQLTDGYYVITEANDQWAMSNNHNGTFLSRTSVTPVDDLITNPDVSIVWSIQTDGSGKTIYNDVTAKFVSYSGSSNNVQVVDDVSSNNQRWNFSYSSGDFIASNVAVISRDLQYNSGSPRFACYTGSQADLMLYKFVESEDAILSAVPGELINLNYIETQGPSLDQELAVSGLNLDGSDVILTLGGNNFELSLDQTTYSNTITLTNFDGTETSIFVRLKENLISNDYNDTLTISGGDADDITVTLQGTVLELFNLPYFNGLRNQVDWDEALAFDFEFNGTSFETSSEGYIKMPINSDIITAPINFSLYNFLEVEFDLTTFGGSSGQELTVFVSNNGIDYTALDAFSVPSSYDTFTQIIDVTAFSATNGRIKFEITGGSNETRFRDLNIKFFEKYMFDGTDWSPSDPNGVATASDDIVITSGNATISSNTSINTVTVNPGASLTIDAVATLTVADNFTLESVSNSYSSLILDGTITGTVNYSRHINTTASTTGNDLISAPLTGQTFTSFVAANSNIVSNSDNSLYLFGPFEKPTNEYITYGSSETATLDPAIGYRAASTDDGNFIFTGTVNKTDKAIPIVSSGTGNTEWNLIGNPYPSYITLSEFLALNGSLFTIERSGVYGYDGDASTGWTIWNQAYSDFNSGALIAPGQGFLVTSKAAGGTVNFTTGMRSSGDTDDFIEDERSSTVINISQLKLQITNSTKMFNTDFYFNDTATLGLNPGYDSGLLGSVSDFALYSHLVEENTGLALGIQTLNNTNLSTEVMIPLGVNANQGEQLTFSIAESTLVNSVNVYLEDNVANTSTLLTTGDYILTPNTNLSGTGRFFLRFTEEALSTVENSFNNLNIYTSKATKEIVVNGQLAENTMCNIYDVQGRLVSTTQLNHTTLENRINISTVSTGIYIVKLQSNNLEKTQKLIIE